MPTAARPATARKPADRKPKATKPEGFTFEANGATYTLPHPSEALAKIPGKAFRDAMLGGEIGEMKFAMTCVEAVDADPSALEALYAKPTDEMLRLLGMWLSSADMSGATLPQS